MEDHKRSVAKAVTWRAVATMITMTLVFVFTGNVILSAGVGMLDTSAKILFYYLHERVWNRINWGRKRWDKKIKKALKI